MLHDKYKAWNRVSKDYDADDDIRFPLIVRIESCHDILCLGHDT
jgi:hypothetical protein